MCRFEDDYLNTSFEKTKHLKVKKDVFLIEVL